MGNGAFSGLPPRGGRPTPGVNGTEDAALIVLYGLVAFGQIQLRKIDGYKQLPSFIAKEWRKVA